VLLEKQKKKAEKTDKDKKVVETKKEDTKQHKVEASRVADQKAVDEPLIKNIKAVPQLASYLSSVFALRRGDYPHLMKF